MKSHHKIIKTAKVEPETTEPVIEKQPVVESGQDEPKIFSPNTLQYYFSILLLVAIFALSMLIFIKTSH